MNVKYLFKLAIFIAAVFGYTAYAEDTPQVSDNLKLESDGISSFYTFNYPSIDCDGNPIVLSSALVAWTPEALSEEDKIETVIIGCHITIVANYECPTQYPVDHTTSDTALFAMLPVTESSYYKPLRKSVIIIPDYEGYGVTKQRSHPYLSQELTSRQVADAVTYGLSLYRKLAEDGNHPQMSDHFASFCIGFSQGGAVALATQRHIETNKLSEQLHFAGSLCGDGPYDLITTLRYYMEDDGNSYGVTTEHRNGTLSMTIALPLIIKGMCDSNPYMKSHSLSDYFTKQFIDTGIIGWIEDKSKEKAEQKSTGDIDKLLYQICEDGIVANDGTTYTPEQMQEMFPTHEKIGSWFSTGYKVIADLSKVFTPDCYDYLSNPDNFQNTPEENGDAMTDLHRALASNSLVYGWEPEHRIAFMHSKHDMIVPYGNYEVFAENHPDADTRIDVFTENDHIAAGTTFYLGMLGETVKHIQWIAEAIPPDDVEPVYLDSRSDDDAWYTITGLRLTSRPSTPGIYIHHGKKHIIR